mmetsp:Transcript_60018/g.173810  ORF Transcript_60018/g.173810 Transcript_60018/m.173810 type:complete len:477 (-) Transcript_60018:199-1629(-)
MRANDLPVCAPEVVQDTCQLLRQGDRETEPLLSVSLRQISAGLGMCGDVKFVWDMMGLLTHRANLDAGKADCMELCKSTESYLRAGRWIVPRTSDTSCFDDPEEGMICDIDVSPERVVEEMRRAQYKGMNDTRESDRGVNGRQNPEEVFPSCPFQGEWAIVRLAQLFRFYPRLRGHDTVHTWPLPLSLGRRRATYFALANTEAWLSLTLRAMIDRQLAPIRKKWFGGPGPLPDETVRRVVWRVLAYAMTQFTVKGLHIALGQDCSGELAYVWRQPHRTGLNIRPNLALCYDDGECGMADDGRYFVYLCDPAFTQINSEADFVTLFLHETVHHAGPRDISYRPSEMKEELSQTEQLNNADSYQRFLLEVVEGEGEGSLQESQFWRNSSTERNLESKKNYNNPTPGKRMSGDNREGRKKRGKMNSKKSGKKGQTNGKKVSKRGQGRKISRKKGNKSQPKPIDKKGLRRGKKPGNKDKR